VNYKHMLNSRSIYEQIGVSNTFLRHTQKKLFTFKNSPVFFGPPCMSLLSISVTMYSRPHTTARVWWSYI